MPRITTGPPASGGGGSSLIQSGTGAPTGGTSHTPALYFDTTNNGLWCYVDAGLSFTGWERVGGIGDLNQAGVGMGSNGTIYLVSPAPQDVIITDVAARQNSGNSLEWGTNDGTDGHQELYLGLGTDGAYLHTWARDGTYHNANGIFFPTTNPHIVGAWWDNAGVLTKSAG